MRFFFLEEDPPRDRGPWSPPRPLLRHLQALRFLDGQELLLLPPAGEAYAAVYRDPGALELDGRRERPALPLLPVTLATAWPKGPRADELMVRAAEAGVTRILPLQCARSVAGRKDFSPARLARWQKLLRETCQQCRRPEIPQLAPRPLTPGEALERCPGALPVALLPGTAPLGVQLDLHEPAEVLLFIGPEGGFDDAEEAWFRDHGIAHAGLLPTVLRIEAAGPAAAVLVQHHALRRRGH